MNEWTFDDVVIATRQMHKFNEILSMVHAERDEQLLVDDIAGPVVSATIEIVSATECGIDEDWDTVY